MRNVQPGELIGGKYVFERIIGRGGVGIIAAARHVTLKQLVALKFLRPEMAGDPEVVRRFLREAQAAAQIRSEHVARVLDTGMLDDGTVFLVFEYLAGRDLAAVLRDDGPLPIVDAVDYLTQACEAVAEGHALGIVHRDLKPANLFLTHAPDGAPFIKVLDFGLSKFSRSTAATALTADNHVIGSPHFMSPEQMRSSRDADARSDIWALGVVLFGLLTGRVPFEGEYLTEVCAAILEGKSLSLRALRPDAPPALEEVILRCLRTDPAERYQSVTQLVDALRPFAPDSAQARAERIVRVVDTAQRTLDDQPNVANSESSPGAALHRSSAVSWSISVAHARERRATSVPSAPSLEAGHDTATAAAAPRLTHSNATAPAKVRSRKRPTVVAAAALGLVASVGGAAWMDRSAAVGTESRAASASGAPLKPTSGASASIAVRQAAEQREALARSGEMLEPASSAGSADAPRPHTAPPSTRPVAPKAPKADRSRRASATPTKERSPVPEPARAPRDEELILSLPH